jgi:hypothetical protein
MARHSINQDNDDQSLTKHDLLTLCPVHSTVPADVVRVLPPHRVHHTRNRQTDSALTDSHSTLLPRPRTTTITCRLLARACRKQETELAHATYTIYQLQVQIDGNSRFKGEKVEQGTNHPGDLAHKW